jgi:hypothetical protein
MPHPFIRVAAWIARQISAPVGRHRRQHSLHQAPLMRAPVLTSAEFTAYAGPPPPHWSLIRAEETVLVRPYVLAAESRLASAVRL